MINKIEQKIQDCSAQGSPGEKPGSHCDCFFATRERTQITLNSAVYALDHSKLN